SLAANIFFVSAAAGLWMQDDGDEWKNRPRGPAGWFERRLGKDAPDELIQAARAAFTRRQEEMQGARETVRSSREYVAMTIGEQPFDLEKFRAAVAESDRLRLERSRIFNDIVQELVESLDDDGRAAMSKALRMRIEERRKRREEREKKRESAE
ncbi:MAG: periplasmic heavy metal sensor, partial [Rhodobacteraceae bacterium]|nr:periplasmic heavy metal sensor [Paracoccaceae bacterium]